MGRRGVRPIRAPIVRAGDQEGEKSAPDLTARGVAWLGIGFGALVLAVYGGALRAPFSAADELFYVANPYTVELTFANLVAILDPSGEAKFATFNYAPLHLLLSPSSSSSSVPRCSATTWSARCFTP